MARVLVNSRMATPSPQLSAHRWRFVPLYFAAASCRDHYRGHTSEVRRHGPRRLPSTAGPHEGPVAGTLHAQCLPFVYPVFRCFCTRFHLARLDARGRRRPRHGNAGHFTLTSASGCVLCSLSTTQRNIELYSQYEAHIQAAPPLVRMPSELDFDETAESDRFDVSTPVA